MAATLGVDEYDKDNSGGIVSTPSTSNRIWKIGVANKFWTKLSMSLVRRSCTSNSEAFLLELPVRNIIASSAIRCSLKLVASIHKTPNETVIQIVTHVKIHLQQSKETTKSLQIAQLPLRALTPQSSRSLFAIAGVCLAHSCT